MFILMSNQRGTSSFLFNGSFKKWFREKNSTTQIGSDGQGKKISINKGTKSIWIVKKSFIGIPHKNKILVVNRGTRRLKL